MLKRTLSGFLIRQEQKFKQEKHDMVDGVKRLQQKEIVAVLQSDNLNQENAFRNPDAISTGRKQIRAKGEKIMLPLQPYSVNVIRVNIS